MLPGAPGCHRGGASLSSPPGSRLPRSCALGSLALALATLFLVTPAAGQVVPPNPPPSFPSHVGGQWGPILVWPHVPVSMANLPDGRILTYASNEPNAFPLSLDDEYTHAAIWDYRTGEIKEVPHPSHDMFCGAMVTLENGETFVMGGRNMGSSPWVSYFDFHSDRWVQLAADKDMNRGRWYGTAVYLGNGGVFIAAGVDGGIHPERWTPGSGWTLLTGIDLTSSILQYGAEQEGAGSWPLLQLDDDGTVFHHGATPTMSRIDPYGGPSGLGTITDLGPHNFDWYPDEGVSVLYDQGKILVAGGSTTISNPTASTHAYSIDINGPGPVLTPVAAMNLPRQFQNEVLLPTGDVLVVGGNTSGFNFTDALAVLNPEAWDPDTNTWKLWNAQNQARAYHSTALLLVDGTVLSAGGGLAGNACPANEPETTGECGADHWNAEVFSPPYLFDPDGSPATRPVIDGAPGILRVGRTFTLHATPGLSAFSMIRMSATTHTMNTDQRFLRPSFAETAPGVYQVTLHSNQNVLVPGYWMLFGLEGDVPSVAKVIQVVKDGKPRGPPITSMRNDIGDEVLYQIEAEDPDGHPLTFAAAGLPVGLTLDPTTGIVDGTVTQAGLYNVSVLALDGSEASNINFQWVVSSATSEMGTVSVSQPDRSTWQSVVLAHQYEHPVVVMGPPSYADTSPLTLRVRNVTPTGFQFRIEEWPYQNGGHGAETISYLVVEAGEYFLPEGGTLIAGISPGIDFDNPWTQPFAAGAFAETPLVLAQVATATGSSPPAVTPRLEDVTPDGFVVKLQTQEQDSQNFAAEDVHWIAVEPAAVPGLLEAGIFSAANQSQISLTPNPISYSQGFSSAPRLLAGIQTTNESDPATLRYQSLTAAGVQLLVQEETSAETSLTHTNELVGWLAIDPLASTLGLLHLFNEPPRVIDPGDQEGMRDDAASLFIQAIDPEGSPLTFSATGLPPGLSIHPDTGEISGTIAAAGLYAVSVTATDPNGDSDVASFIWSVSEKLELLQFPTPPALAGASVDYTAVANLSGSLTYTWDFGDGTPPLGPSSSTHASHSFAAPGRYTMTLSVSDPATSQSDQLQFVQNVTGPPTPLRPHASSSIAYEAAHDRVWVVNPDNDSVSVIDALSNTRIAEIPVSRDPRTLALAADGRVWVVCKDDAVIAIIDPSTLAVVQNVGLKAGSQPHGIAFDPLGANAFVALEASGKVLRLDGFTGAELASRDVGRHVRHLAVTANGSRVWASRFVTPPLPGEASGVPQSQQGGHPVGGEVLRLDATTLAVLGTTTLEVSTNSDGEQSARGVPNYLGAPAVSPDGSELLIPSKQDNVLRGGFRDQLALTHDTTVRAITSRVDLQTGLEQRVARVDHDDASVASATIFSDTGAYAFTALEGNRQVSVLDPFGHFELGRVLTGRAPQGMVLSPDGRRLYVDNFMDRSVSVFDLGDLLDFDDADLPLVATVARVSSEALAPNVFSGKQFFYDARDPRMALQSYMACAACHNDGGQDGRVWDFTDLGQGLRNTIGLQGHGVGHGRVHWTANFDEVQDFEGQIRHFGGLGLMADTNFQSTADPLGAPKAGLSADLDALAAYVASLTDTGDSPERASDGSFTSEAAAGREVFAAAGCGGCHRGVAFTDSALGVMHDVGTLKSGSGPQTLLDTPTLRGLFTTPPYLHDGSAPTIAGAIAAHSGVSLSPAELADLSAYLEQIDAAESVAPNGSPTIEIVAPADGAQVTSDEGVALAGMASDAEDGDLSALITWSSNVQGELGTGASLAPVLSLGTHQITASVTDSGALVAQAHITVHVNANAAPTVSILAPANGTSVNAGSAVSLSGTASDAEDGDLSAEIAWSSNLQGALGTGASLAPVLSIGTHTITAAVTDSGALVAQAHITVHVNGNEAPTVSILAPASGTSVNAGSAVSLSGTASDAVDGDLSAGIAWSSNLQGALGTGASLAPVLSVGTHIITASVTDSGDLVAQAHIAVHVVNANAAPTVSILAPADGASVNDGFAIELSGLASDAEDGDLSAEIAWSSNLQGALGTGAMLGPVLSVGTHVITAAVTDSGALVAQAHITVHVNGNAAPTVSILAPANGTSVNAGSAVSLSGTASDVEDGDLSASIAWSSNLQGALGSGASLAPVLSLGTHQITASVTDSGGHAGIARIGLTVILDVAPTVTIVNPTDGAEVTEDAPIDLVATALDPVEGDVGANIEWTSSLDGPIGSGPHVTHAHLSLGLHGLTASATDSGGLHGYDQVVLFVPEPGQLESIAACLALLVALRNRRQRRQGP